MIERRRYLYRVKALNYVVDGDTWDFTLEELQPHDFGFGFHLPCQARVRFRLQGIDVVEENQAGGAAAERFAADWIRAAITDDVLHGESFKHQTTVPDASFGRWLIELWRIDTGERLVDALRTAGYEKPRPV